MNNLFAVGLLLVGFSSGSQTQPQQSAQAEQELLKLEREWLDAYLNKDVEAMKRIVADDFLITYSNGSVIDKEETIRRLKSEKKDPNSYHWTEDEKVRFYDRTAIITGRFLWKSKDSRGESLYTDVYVNRNGRWQVVSSHLSKVIK